MVSKRVIELSINVAVVLWRCDSVISCSDLLTINSSATHFACSRSTQTQFIVNPKPFLIDLTGQTVKVKLKWGMEYQGRLASADAYMNLQLTECEEFLDGQFAGFLGEVLIRCNNVLYIQALPAEDGDENDKKASGESKDAVMAD